MRRIVTIDIETLPDPDSAEGHPLATNRSERRLSSALNGDRGRILCIGSIDDSRNGRSRRGVIGWDEQAQRFTCDESQILKEFWQLLADFNLRTDRIVGHNIFDFDLKFIYKRSVICGVRPSVEFSFVRYRNQPIFDTMWEWERWSYATKISLHKLAGVLSLASSKEQGIDGSLVYDFFKAGDHQAIRDYCMRDTQLTRSIYRRLVFADANDNLHKPITRKSRFVS